MKNNTIYQIEELDPYILRVVGFYTLLFNKKHLTVFIAGIICDAVNNSEDGQLELMNDFNEIMSYYKDYKYTCRLPFDAEQEHETVAIIIAFTLGTILGMETQRGMINDQMKKLAACN